MKNILTLVLVTLFGVSGLFAQLYPTVISFPYQGNAVPPSGSYQGIAATSVTVSEGGPNNVVPCVNCVPGVTGSVTTGDPRYLFDFGGNASAAVDITLLIEDTSYTGPCTAVYALEDVGLHQTIISGQQQIFGGCNAGTDYIVYFPASYAPKGGTSGALKGGVAIKSGSVASAVEQALQFNDYPPPSGIIGPSTITIGTRIAGLPCYLCAPSWLNGLNLSIPTPMYVVPRNEPLMVTLEVQDSSYNGPCTFVYQIKEATTVVAAGSHAASCAPHSVKIPTFYPTIPAETPTGPAMLSGGVIAGGQTYAMGQPILIQ